jgi:hypothetical protein
LNVVWVEVLKLKSVLEEDHPDEPPGGDEEGVLVERHKRDDVSLRRMRHGPLPGNLPLYDIGERR